MVNAGRVAIVPQGEWSADATYKRLDAVTYNNTLYFAKKDVSEGTATSNTEYWSKSIVGGAGGIATTENAGIVKPDGTTITIDEDGTIHGQSEITVDGTTITLDEAKGIISLAKTLQEKIKTIDNKLPSTSVVNNNTTTEAGFALDARQANPTIEGTLAANILQLNNDSNSGLQEYTATVSAGVKIVSQKSQYLKIGKLVFVNISLWCDPSESTDPAYISLPYPVGSFRNFGAVTYYINAKNYKNLYVSANAGNQHCYIGALLTDNVPHVFDGTDMSTIQFSLLYVTD